MMRINSSLLLSLTFILAFHTALAQNLKLTPEVMQQMKQDKPLDESTLKAQNPDR